MRVRKNAVMVNKNPWCADGKPWNWLCVDERSDGWPFMCNGDRHATHEVAMSAVRVHLREAHGVRW